MEFLKLGERVVPETFDMEDYMQVHRFNHDKRELEVRVTDGNDERKVSVFENGPLANQIVCGVSREITSDAALQVVDCLEILIKSAQKDFEI